MYIYNGIVLALGFFLLVIYVIKLWSGGRLLGVKGLFKSHVPVTLFLVFALMMIVTTLLNGVPEIAVVGDAYRGEGLMGFLSYIIYFLMVIPDSSFLLYVIQRSWVDSLKKRR